MQADAVPGAEAVGQDPEFAAGVGGQLAEGAQLFAAQHGVEGLAVPPGQVLLGGDEQFAAGGLEQADPVGAQHRGVGAAEDFKVGAVAAHQAFFGGDPEGAGAVFADAADRYLRQALLDHPAAEVVGAEVRRRPCCLGGEGPQHGKYGKDADGSQEASPGDLLLRNTVTRGDGRTVVLWCSVVQSGSLSQSNP